MNDAALAPHILEEAATWLLLMQDAPLAPAQQAEFERWRGSSSDHQRAWKRAERLLARMGALPPVLAKPTLQRPAHAGRRAMLRSLVVLLAAAPMGWLAWRHQAWREWLAADYVTAVGERLDIKLEDGAQIALNTDTALDIRYDERQRLLRLRRGEIHIATATDTQRPPRPFLVQSDHGLMLALGTRFTVRQFTDCTLLTVYQGAVQIHLDGAGARPGANIIESGHQVRFDRDSLGAIEAANANAVAWRKGLLVADDMPVRQWAEELMRYGGERIECDTSLRPLRVSGAFPINDLPLAVGMLAQTYGLRTRRDGPRINISR